MGEASNACQNNPDDQASMTVIRRGFHTLKGSGRMVGLNDLGEVAWRHEQLMNGWLTEKKAASSEMLRLIGRACGVFQGWVNALQANQSVALPVPALLAAVDRVAQGQPLDAPVVEAVALAQAPVEAVVEIEAGPESWTEPETTAAGMDAVAAPEAETEWQPLSLTDAGLVSEGADVIAVLEQDAVADDEAIIIDSFVEATAPESVDAAPVEADDMPPEAVETTAEVPALNVGAIIEYAAAEAAAVEPAEPVVLEEADPLWAEAQMESHLPDEICIGSVCLSMGLHEIFIAEAHQRLAVLQEEAERHAELANSAVSEHARRAVHTLGGIAGTAGITVLSDLSQALEQYWNRFVHLPLPSAHLPLVQETVARLHEMITTIESGHLPETANDLIAALGELEDEQAMPAAESAATLADPALDEIVAQTDETAEAAYVEPPPADAAVVGDAVETDPPPMLPARWTSARWCPTSNRLRRRRYSNAVRWPMRSTSSCCRFSSKKPRRWCRIPVRNCAPGEPRRMPPPRAMRCSAICTPSRAAPAWSARCAWAN